MMAKYRGGAAPDDNADAEVDQVASDLKSRIRRDIDEQDAAAAAQDEDKAVARMMKRMHKRGGAPAVMRGGGIIQQG